MTSLNVSEIFYSLQGEGARAGTPTVFIRLQGCSAKHACYQSGVHCDTEFESGTSMTLQSLLNWAQTNAPSARWITWTGGEPLDQLEIPHFNFFREKGYLQAVETSGMIGLDEGVRLAIDFLCVSPKVAEHVLKKHILCPVDELRYVRHLGQPSLPFPSIEATHYWLSPHSDGANINPPNLAHCINLIQSAPKTGPMWRLSVQQHKYWRVL